MYKRQADDGTFRYETEVLLPSGATLWISLSLIHIYAVTPNIGTGFDLGVEIHGLVADKFGYEVGLFNGTGASVNLSLIHI